MKHRYSPLPMESYRYGSYKAHEMDVIARSASMVSIWNLFWLSTPTLDAVPGSGEMWWKHHQPRVGALRCIMLDVLADEGLNQHLRGHPQTFVDWFEGEDHTIYDTWSLLGSKAWVDTVLSRAQIAADREILAHPLVSTRGNVIQVNFKRAA